MHARMYVSMSRVLQHLEVLNDQSHAQKEKMVRSLLFLQVPYLMTYLQLEYVDTNTF